MAKRFGLPTSLLILSLGSLGPVLSCGAKNRSAEAEPVLRTASVPNLPTGNWRHPFLIFDTNSKDAAPDDPWNKAGEKSQMERRLASDVTWEGNRSQGILAAAMALWRNPTEVTKAGTPLIDLVDANVARIGIPTIRKGDGFPPAPGQKGGWARILEASETLWNYAIAYDLLIGAGTPRTQAAAEGIYARVTDGGFHMLVEHLQTLPDPSGKRLANNWFGRELAGIGIACLAFDPLSKEPAGSRRRKDWENGLGLVRRDSQAVLTQWAPPGEDQTYYYEGPHYLYYWVNMYLPFARAHARLFPTDTPAAMRLNDRGPLAQLLRGQCSLLVPGSRTAKDEVIWSPPPLDDSWLEPDSVGALALLAAAWIDSPTDRPFFLEAARRTRTKSHRLLVGDPVLAQAARINPRELAASVCAQSGMAVLRSGSTADDLHVTLKNSVTLWESDAPQLRSHTHSDSGSVTAYRSGEPILADPGYGPGGYSNPSRSRSYSNWLRHNVLLVSGKGYDPKVRAAIGEDSTFELPAWRENPPQTRVAVADRGAKAFLPSGTRRVLVVDDGLILVVDRLRVAKRIQLNWWGNGSRAATPGLKGAADRLVGAERGGPSAALDAARFAARYTRSERFTTEIRCVVPGDATAELADGVYGPSWNQTEMPMSGLRVTSQGLVSYAITAIQVEPSQNPRFDLDLKPMPDGNGGLGAVALTRRGKKLEYRFSD